MTVATGEEGALLGRPDSLHDEKDPEDREGQRTHQDHAKACEGSGELVTTPVTEPADPNQDGGQSRNPDRGQVDT